MFSISIMDGNQLCLIDVHWSVLFCVGRACQQLINIDSNKISNENNINLMTEELCIRRNIDDAPSVQNNIVKNNISLKTIEDKIIGCPKNLKYFGDIKTSHITTPKSAKRALDIAAKKISQDRKKTRTLQKASNKFRKKIKSFKDLVQQLRKKDLITENAADVSLVS